MEIVTDHAKFFTATIYKWKPLLQQDKYKDLIIDSLRYLVEKKRVFVYAFVIMPNHIHLIWQMRPPHSRKDVQRDFLKFTAQRIKHDLTENDPQLLLSYEVNLKDRKFQFWQRNPLSIDVYSRWVIEQKLNYIHKNPVRAGLVKLPEEYRFSSFLYYQTGKSEFQFLSHHDG